MSKAAERLVSRTADSSLSSEGDIIEEDIIEYSLVSAVAVLHLPRKT